MRYGEKRDANEPDIVRALEDVGCSVERLPGGNGRPDLLVGRLGETYLLEVKDPKGRNRHEEAQQDWDRRWKGRPKVVVRDRYEALRAVGIPVASPAGARRPEDPRSRRPARPVRSPTP